MNAPQSRPGPQRTWLIGLALLSLAIPVAAGFVRAEPAGSFADPARLSYYRQTIVATAIAIACAAGTFAGARALRPAVFSRLSMIVASLGLLVSLYLLVGLIGSCGLQVFWGACGP